MTPKIKSQIKTLDKHIALVKSKLMYTDKDKAYVQSLEETKARLLSEL